ncbi:MAG: acetolactate synthase small subunit, partial [Lachnospiraceae bacterium]|nr:acetolactate synthase small subunit [Lachnospiraceae bacterium]
AFINVVKDYNILEIARTGIAGLARGKDRVVYLP